MKRSSEFYFHFIIETKLFLSIRNLSKFLTHLKSYTLKYVNYGVKLRELHSYTIALGVFIVLYRILIFMGNSKCALADEKPRLLQV